jgi:hypothetical protein
VPDHWCGLRDSHRTAALTSMKLSCDSIGSSGRSSIREEIIEPKTSKIMKTQVQFDVGERDDHITRLCY